ncbi:hypothetical protein PF003_g21983 [Phytophthora fragariae]|nr:hypothetical protein PF003_g21983 [Phytophthora fragariae]
MVLLSRCVSLALPLGGAAGGTVAGQAERREERQGSWRRDQLNEERLDAENEERSGETGAQR